MTAEEFNKTVDLYADNVYRFIFKNIKDNEKAKDIVQDAFEKMWVKVDDINFRKAKSYLFTTAYHKMIDDIRKENRHKLFAEITHHEISHNQQYNDVKEILNNALERLPSIQRSVILLRDYEGYEYSEIGEITGLSESQVKVYIFRGRSFLKKHLVEISNII